MIYIFLGQRSISEKFSEEVFLFFKGLLKQQLNLVKNTIKHVFRKPYLI